MTSEVAKRGITEHDPEPDDLKRVNDFMTRVMAIMEEFKIRSVSISFSAETGSPTQIVIVSWGDNEEVTLQ